jgi:uncharacterized membrane protein YgcG
MTLHTTRWARLLIALAVGLAVAATLLPSAVATAASAKSFSLITLDTRATINADGSMDVVETVSYSFSGTFTVGIRSFERNESDIRDFRVVDENGTPLRIETPSQSISGDWEWFFASPLRNTVHTFVLSYTVEDAVRVGPDVGELYWQFIGNDHPGINQMTVSLDVPGEPPNATPDTPDDDATVLRAWGHGPPNGQVTLGVVPELPDVRAYVVNVPASAFVELRVLMPSDTFDVAPSGGPRLPGVLEEEGGFTASMTAKPDALRDITGVAAPVASVAGVIALVLLWFGFGREPRPVEVLGEYWREPLDDPPAVALTNLRRGSVPQGDAIAATIIDMAQRGYLTIEGVHQERLGPDKQFHVFRWAGKEYEPDVRPFERRVMEMVFHGRTEVTDDDISAWAKANRTTAASRLSGMTKLLGEEHESRGYDAPTQGWALALLALVCLLVGGTGALAIVAGAWQGWIAAPLALVLFLFGFKVLANRSQVGAEAAARAEGLKRYLTDFSNLEEAPVGHLILWERYLVYAVAFGVASDLMRGLSTRLPHLAQDPAFGLWYVGPRGRFDGIDSMRDVGTSIRSSFTPPSSSGSGGGFSGGGGGGGGGGGFGAR